MPSDSVSFDRAVEYYDQTRGFPRGVDVEAVKLFVQAGKLTKASRVLEIGIGTGRIALPLSRHVGAYYGLDLSAGMLGKLRSKQTDEPVYVAQGDATQVPYRAGVFDAAVAVHIFHLIPGWRDALAEVARVLKPTGLLLHGGVQRSSEDRLNEVWRAAIKQDRHGPIPQGEDERFLEKAGWSHAGDTIFRYSYERAPQQFLESIRNRIWSSCWDMSDEELEAGYQIMLAYIQEHYPDPSKPVAAEQTFRVRAYKRSN
jgi:SAM-dependent methyltransferase